MLTLYARITSCHLLLHVQLELPYAAPIIRPRGGKYGRRYQRSTDGVLHQRLHHRPSMLNMILHFEQLSIYSSRMQKRHVCASCLSMALPMFSVARGGGFPQHGATTRSSKNREGAGDLSLPPSVEIRGRQEQPDTCSQRCSVCRKCRDPSARCVACILPQDTRTAKYDHARADLNMALYKTIHEHAKYLLGVGGSR